MANCIIRPIPLSEWTMDKSMVTYRLNFGQAATLVGYVWYTEGLKEKILVDAGIKEVLLPTENLKEARGLPTYILDAITLTPIETITEVLEHALLLDNTL